MKKLTALLLVMMLFASLLPVTAMAATRYERGDIVTFGSYEQDKNLNNGSEDIEWLVLGITKDGKSMLLISRYCLDWVQFNDEKVGVTWEDSYVREWLNDTFLNEAFTRTEQKRMEVIYSEMPNTEPAAATAPGIW